MGFFGKLKTGLKSRAKSAYEGVKMSYRKKYGAEYADERRKANLTKARELESQVKLQKAKRRLAEEKRATMKANPLLSGGNNNDLFKSSSSFDPFGSSNKKRGRKRDPFDLDL